ncbi:PD-(D/E)XK nuclease family protein [Anaerohalosphaeraceae bacterium U12dextr]
MNTKNHLPTIIVGRTDSGRHYTLEDSRGQKLALILMAANGYADEIARRCNEPAEVSEEMRHVTRLLSSPHKLGKVLIQLTGLLNQPKLNERRLTCSQIKCFRKCHRKHMIAYILGIRPAEEAHYFRMGQAFHTGLDLRSRGCTTHQAIIGALEQYDRHIPQTNDDEIREKLTIEREVMVRLLGGYFWRWEQMDRDIKVIASELPFELEIVHPIHGISHPVFKIAGKIDKIIQLPDGRLAVMEHKTTSDEIDPTSNYWRRLRMDIQISIYCLAAQRLGYNVDTILYDVVRKPSFSKPKQLTQIQTKELISSGKYFARFNDEAEPMLVGEYAVTQGNDLSYLIVNCDCAAVTQHAKGISIAETLGMYGDRISADMGRRCDYYFARREIPRLITDLRDTELDLWHYAELIYENLETHRWLRNDDACNSFGTCPYLDLCTGDFDLSVEALPEGFIRIDDVHQELMSE